MSESEPTDRLPLTVEHIKDHLLEKLSGIGDLDIVLFGSNARGNQISAESDIDIWISGEPETENRASELLSQDSELPAPYDVVRLGDYAGRPELESAMRFVVGSTGVLIAGELPSYPEDFDAEKAAAVFSAAALRQAEELIDRADIIERSGGWSNGSFSREAARSLLYAQSARTGDWASVKKLDAPALAKKLEDVDIELGSLIRTSGWDSREAIAGIRKIIETVAVSAAVSNEQ
ncbi:MAG TPA: nucleotidyltransferase domain-containing protein [Candidatus Nitrosopolaris sp.]|nr:nucleotidyltransferase domain-containing protein [Candidatus Nitrosopolaris sp.]